ncbi:uncharacterized protein LOC100569064 isoform X2 [Acyrthosiphon pisum]|uniref:Uncharacterized protein n=1 Tax=Acyrthosiphon pisum TaxID=7029 RepID=A0A8R2NPN9_ACYPI|nr:uncharacterized protein LOC100569064 isoform X2 [Acyrthosiphon pisum]
MTGIKKIKTVSNNENSDKIVLQKAKKSNSKHKGLMNASNRLNIMKDQVQAACIKLNEEEQCTAEIIEENSSNLPDKDDKETTYFRDSGRRKSKRLSKRRKIESVGYEEELGTAEIIEESSSNLPDKDGNETAKLEKVQLTMKCLVHLKDYYKMESPNIIETMESEMKQCTETTTEYSSNLPDKNEDCISPVSLESAEYRKPKSFKKNKKMESVGYEEEQGISKTILENSSTLPDTDDNEGSIHEKPKAKKVTFNKLRRIKKFSSKSHFKSNSNNKKEKDASENKPESRKTKSINKTDTLGMSSSNTEMKSVGYEEERCTAEIIEENSSNLPDKDDNETTYFRDSGRRKSKRFTKRIKKESVGYEEEEGTAEIIEEIPSNSPDKDCNKTAWQNILKTTEMESVGYEQEQATSETTLENSSILLDIDDEEIILTESATLEIIQNMNISSNLEKLENTMKSQNTKIINEMKQCTETTTEYSSILPNTDDNETILTESAKLEMECSSNFNSKIKRKLSKVEVIVEVLQDYLKRFKSS